MFWACFSYVSISACISCCKAVASIPSALLLLSSFILPSISSLLFNIAVTSGNSLGILVVPSGFTVDI